MADNNGTKLVLRNRCPAAPTCKARLIQNAPWNYRRHPKEQMDALRGSFKEIGMFKPLDVWSPEPGVYMLVDGEARNNLINVEVDPDWDVPINPTDLTEEEAKKALLIADPISAMAQQDKVALDALAKEVTFDDAALAGVVTSLREEVGLSAEPDVNVVEDEVPQPPDHAITKNGDIWILGDHRLMCGDSGNPAHLDRLLDGAVIHLVNMDPPYNVKVEPRSNNAIAAGLSSFTQTHHQGLDLARHPGKSKATDGKLRPKDRPLANDFVTDEAFDEMLDAWFGNASRVLQDGRGFYIWGGYANCANYPPVLKKHGLYFSQAIIWDKQHPVLTRKDYMGAHEWCQPPDTMVLSEYGSVFLRSLRDGDRVIPYSTNWSDRIAKRGVPVRVGTRHYDGQLYGLVAEDRQTYTTDGHIFTVRLDQRSDDAWCVYLMRRGPWWRVGKCKIAGQWYGFGLKSRLRQERAESAWILSTHNDLASAMCAEQIASVKYGIPTTHWEVYGSRSGLRDVRLIRSIYDALDLNRLHESAVAALLDAGRRFEYPLVHAGNMHAKLGRRDPFQVRACNVLPGFMSVPVQRQHRKAEFVPVRAIDRQPYVGPVFSLDVPVHQHYVADGIVTHNCFYGWKEGAAHQFFGPTNAQDLWHVKKVNPQSMVHLTEKPVELAVRAIQYSSKPGENVLDLFGGSGSTLMGAEQTGRHAFLMELDELYCDVIVKRWEAFTGRKAERIPAPEAETAPPAAEMVTPPPTEPAPGRRKRQAAKH